MDKKLNDTTIELEGKQVSFDELYSVEETELTQAYTTQASRLAYIGSRAAMAEALYNEAKADKERTYASVELDWRDELDRSGAKSTEAKLRSLVITDSEYIEAAQKENEALQNYKVLRALVDAMRQRGDMLISLGATLRQEFDVTNMALLGTKEKLKRMQEHTRE